MIRFELAGRRVAAIHGGTDDVAAMTGASLYFLEAGGHVSIIEPIFGIVHKYAKLLLICSGVMLTGCGAFALALKPRLVEISAEDGTS